MVLRPINDGLPWTREQLVLAFELYCRIPFQKTKANNPKVKDLANILGRAPASVARKLGNFGAFDSKLAARNISGLTHGSKLDKEVWDKFHADWNGLIVRAHNLRQKIASDHSEVSTYSAPTGPSEKLGISKQRLHQAFFRDAVMSSYNYRCCITGIPLAECLVAGHIIPWSVSIIRRADPTNGVCMSATFDRLFDAGLITVSDDLTVCVSERLRKLHDKALVDCVVSYHGRKIIAPMRFYPDVSCLQWHRKNIFQVV